MQEQTPEPGAHRDRAEHQQPVPRGPDFDPPAELAASANVKAEVYDEAAADRPAFWGEQAKRLDWGTPFTEVLDWSNPPFAKWFVGGHAQRRLQLRRPPRRGRQRRPVALHFVGEPADDTRDITYAELKDQVCQAANALTTSASRPATGSRSTCR